jgi:hypothetical protein
MYTTIMVPVRKKKLFGFNSINIINNEKLVLLDFIQRKSIINMSNDYACNNDCNPKP